MGYMRHHAIVLTCFNKESADIVRAKAGEIGLDPSPLHHSVVNGYWSFWCPPDGSKEGWSESDAGDARHDDRVGGVGRGDEEIVEDFLEGPRRHAGDGGNSHGTKLLHGERDRETRFHRRARQGGRRWNPAAVTAGRGGFDLPFHGGVSFGK